MKRTQRRRIVTVVLLIVSLVIAPFAATVQAESAFEYIWPTPEIGADPAKSGTPEWISASGRYVSMTVKDPNQQNPQTWLADRVTHQAELVNANPYVNDRPQFSDNTRYVVYWQLVGTSDMQLHVKDRVNGTDTQLGVDPAAGTATAVYPTRKRMISRDGSVVVFNAKNFMNLPNIPTDSVNVYTYNTQTQTYAIVDDPSVGYSAAATISGDGNYVLYDKFPAGSNTRSFYRKNLATGENVFVGSGSTCYVDPLILSNDGSIAGYNCRYGSQLIHVGTSDSFSLGSSESVLSIADDNKTFLLNNRVYEWTTRNSLPISSDSQFQATAMSGNGQIIIGGLTRLSQYPIPSTIAPVAIAAPSFDVTPPVVQPHLSSPPDSNGWHGAPVDLSWEISDPDSAITSTSGCDAVTVTATTGTTFTCLATSGGGTTTRSITIKVDVTAPVVQPQISPVPNAAGWNNSAASLTWFVNDAESPITASSNCNPVTVNETGGATYACSATSVGGDASSSATVKVDTTVPTVSNLVLNPTLILFSGNLSITADASDGLSGVVGGEYFIDTDPGQGNGTPMSYNGATGKITATKTINSTNMTMGNHTIKVRVKDAAGNWSVLSAKTFRKI